MVLLAETPPPDAATIVAEGSKTIGSKTIVTDQDGKEKIPLTNLEPGTGYKVYVVNTLGNKATAIKQVEFTTPAIAIDLTDVAVTQESYTTATLAATSSPAIGSSIYHMVLFATTPAPDAGTIVAAELEAIVTDQNGQEKISLTNLEPGTDYKVHVVSTLGSKATAVESVEFSTLTVEIATTTVAVTQDPSYTTAVVDVESPAIGSSVYHMVLLAETPPPDAATIVAEGSKTIGSKTIVTDQDGKEKIPLTNLEPGTGYKVYVVNTLGNKATAIKQVEFTTPAIAIDLTDVAVTQESYTTATLAATSSPAIGSSIYHMVLLATTPAPDAGTIVAAELEAIVTD